MYTILICAVIGATIAIVVEYRRGCLDTVVGLLCGAMGGLIGACVGAILAVAISFAAPKEEYVKEKTELVSIRDNISTSGQFFLGSGGVEGKLAYFYYKKVGDNSYKAGHIDAEKAIVIEDGGTYIEKKDKRVIGAWRYFGLGDDLCECGGEVTIHIPQGSIVKDYYKMDLGKGDK